MGVAECREGRGSTEGGLREGKHAQGGHGGVGGREKQQKEKEGAKDTRDTRRERDEDVHRQAAGR